MSPLLLTEGLDWVWADAILLAMLDGVLFHLPQALDWVRRSDPAHGETGYCPSGLVGKKVEDCYSGQKTVDHKLYQYH